MAQNPPPGSEQEYKLIAIVLLCFIILLTGLALGWFVSGWWAILGIAVSLLIYVLTFHFKRHG